MYAHPICSVCSFHHMMIEYHDWFIAIYGFVCYFIASRFDLYFPSFISCPVWLLLQMFPCQVRKLACCNFWCSPFIQHHQSKRVCYLFYKSVIQTFFKTNRHVRHNSMLFYVGHKRQSTPPYISIVPTIISMACNIIPNVYDGVWNFFEYHPFVGSVTRDCLANRMWSAKADYSGCHRRHDSNVCVLRYLDKTHPLLLGRNICIN
jgi:hypothetical protein